MMSAHHGRLCAARETSQKEFGGHVIPATETAASDTDKRQPASARTEVLAEILDQLVALRQLADRQGLRMLKYLIDMAVLEARASLDQAQSKSQKKQNGS